MKIKIVSVFLAVLMAAFSFVGKNVNAQFNALFGHTGAITSYAYYSPLTIASVPYEVTESSLLQSLSLTLNGSGTMQIQIKGDGVTLFDETFTIPLVTQSIVGFNLGEGIPVTAGTDIEIYANSAGTAVKIGRVGDSWPWYRFFGNVGDLSGVNLHTPFVANGTAYLGAEIYHLSQFDSNVSAGISLTDNNSVTQNYSIGYIYSDEYPGNQFWMGIPLFHLNNGNYTVQAWCNGNYSQVQTSTEKTLVINKATQGNGYGNVTTHNGSAMPDYTENNTETGNATVSILGPRFTTYINSTSIQETTVVLGAKITRFGVLDDTANLSLAIWEESDNVTIIQADDVNPVNNGFFASSFYWKTKIGGLTANTTYHVQARYVGSSDNNTTYTADEIMFTTRLVGQGTPPSGDATGTRNPISGLISLAGKMGLDNTVGHMIMILGLMLIAALIFMKDKMLRVAFPGVIAGIGMITQWIPVAISVMLVILCALVVWRNFRTHVSGAG